MIHQKDSIFSTRAQAGKWCSTCIDAIKSCLKALQGHQYDAMATKCVLRRIFLDSSADGSFILFIVKDLGP